MKKKYVGFLLMALSAVGIAFAMILMKLIPQITGLSPQHVAIWRFSIAAPLLWLVILFQDSPSNFIPEHPWWFMGLGFVYSVASFSALFALERLPSSLYVIIVHIYPSIVVIYSLMTRRAVPKLYWFGLPLTIIGLVLTVYKFGSALAVDTLGLVITIINAFAMMVYLILSEKIFNRIPERWSGTNWMLTGAMLTGLLLIPLLGVSSPDSVRGWLLLISFAIFGTLLPILGMNISLQLLGAARGSVIMTLTPVLAVLFSTIFLGEELSLQQWFGGALVITAIIILQTSPDRTIKQEHQQVNI